MNNRERQFIAKRLDLFVDKNGFIPIPEFITHIKIDVGLSFTAPHALNWLNESDDLFVIGFEPLAENVEILRKTLSKEENNSIKDRFLIVSCALANSIGVKEIFVTSDKGLASILEPKQYSIETTRTIKTETLDNFMNLVNLDKFDKIDYIKTDCQGFDLEVLKGATNILKSTVVVTCEAESDHYEGANNSTEELQMFFEQIGFEYINKVSAKSKFIRKIMAPLLNFIGPRSNTYEKFIKKRHDLPVIVGANLITIDPTFINSRLKHFVTRGDVSAHQFN